MEQNKIFLSIISFCLIIIAVSVGYYFLIYLPRIEQGRVIQESQNKTEKIKKDCISSVKDELQKINPNGETQEITDYRVANDRGCYIEAGCMQGVHDNNFQPKFSLCSQEYYKICLDGIKSKVNEMIEAEVAKRIDECVNLYSN